MEERPNLNSRNKYYDARHRKEIEAHSHTREQDARHPEELVPRREERRVAPPNSIT